MIYALNGKIALKQQNFFVIDVGGVSLKVFSSENNLKNIPISQNTIKIFTYLHVREDALELYGFISEEELGLFESLISISGIGPKSALSVLSLGKIDQIIAAINEGRTELLTRASGIGKKTSERIILELKGKLTIIKSAHILNLMESDLELEETLISLGYSRMEAKSAINAINPKITGFKERLKEALKNKKN